MPTATPCPDCTDLVGAPAFKAPHDALLPLEKEPDTEGVFRCADCRSRWAIEQLGWARLVT